MNGSQPATAAAETCCGKVCGMDSGVGMPVLGLQTLGRQTGRLQLPRLEGGRSDLPPGLSERRSEHTGRAKQCVARGRRCVVSAVAL